MGNRHSHETAASSRCDTLRAERRLGHFFEGMEIGQDLQRGERINLLPRVIEEDVKRSKIPFTVVAPADVIPGRVTGHDVIFKCKSAEVTNRQVAVRVNVS